MGVAYFVMRFQEPEPSATKAEQAAEQPTVATPADTCNYDAQAINMDALRLSMVYPEEAKERGLQGKVFVRVLVGKTGRIERTIVKRSPDTLLTQEVLRVLPTLHFEPGRQDCEPIMCWVTIPFDFKLQEESLEDILIDLSKEVFGMKDEE